MGVIPIRGTKTNLGPIVSQDGNIRTRICQHCYLQFSYEIGYGKDRKYCSLCSKEIKRIHNSQGYLRQRKIQEVITKEYALGKRVVKRTITDACKYIIPYHNESFESWFVGLFDGEGYFYLGHAKMHPNKRWTYPMRLAIKLRADEIESLIAIQQYFTCGNIEYHKGGGVDNCRRHPQNVWMVARKAYLFHVFVPFFETHPLQTRKREHFEVWKEAIRLAYLNQHKTPEGRVKWENLVSLLRQTREFRPKTLYSA